MAVMLDLTIFMIIEIQTNDPISIFYSLFISDQAIFLYFFLSFYFYLFYFFRIRSDRFH